MPSELPEGSPAPVTGSLPDTVRAGADERRLGVYVHVPYCRVRCGYCDFNTYIPSELNGADRGDYADQVSVELGLAADVLRGAGLPERPVSTVFFGGGTPTLLPSEDLARMLHRIRELWGVAPGAEVTTEANPDSVTQQSLAELAEAGFTRVSFGMQSSVPHVLRTLDRTHDPAAVGRAVAWAKELGLQVSVDLIYGTPGESLDDWRSSLDTALAYEPNHISAYALIIERGTKLAAQIKRGEVPAPDDDLQADMYELADERFGSAGYTWYEISNWARSDADVSRHNLAYWTGEDWWAAGPGAHSHIGGVRWWNVKHPAAYASRIARGESPAHAREVLSDDDRLVERILLELRLKSGLDLSVLGEGSELRVAALVAEGLLDGRAALRGRAQLTLRGRLLADAVVHRLLGRIE